MDFQKGGDDRCHYYLEKQTNSTSQNNYRNEIDQFRKQNV